MNKLLYYYFVKKTMMQQILLLFFQFFFKFKVIVTFSNFIQLFSCTWFKIIYTQYQANSRQQKKLFTNEKHVSRQQS